MVGCLGCICLWRRMGWPKGGEGDDDDEEEEDEDRRGKEPPKRE